MRALNIVGALAVTAALNGCADEDEGVTFDPTPQSFHLHGTFTGYEFAIDEADVTEGEREYSPSRLCEVSASFAAEIDGQPWAFDLEFENFDSESFGVGDYVIIGVDETPGAGQTSFELRMDNDAAHYERSPIAGTIEVMVYDSARTQAGSPGVMEGGSIGAVFRLDFGAGELVEGSFHANIDTITVSDDEDC